jgi:radical SAM-linked protein
MKALTQQRIRIKYGKYGALRFVGHLDMAKTWERILRRAQLPLEYTQGFNPRPRMQFAAALAVGLTSESEYLDAWLTTRLDDQPPEAWIARLAATSPVGIPLYSLEDVPISSAALPTLVTHSEYVITPADNAVTAAVLESRAAELLAQAAIERLNSKDKPYDLRPLILDLRMEDGGNLVAHLKTGEKGNARPDDLLDAMGIEMGLVRAHRRRLFLSESAPVESAESAG